MKIYYQGNLKLILNNKVSYLIIIQVSIQIKNKIRKNKSCIKKKRKNFKRKNQKNK